MVRRTKKDREIAEATKEALGIPEQISQEDKSLDKYMNTMKEIKGKARMETNTLVIKDFTDHKNISLWTKEGKRIGPLHRENAIRTFQRFWDKGIVLSTTQPTESEIEAYKKTAEYKRKAEQIKKDRSIKEKSRKSGQIEKLAKEIATMSGQTVDAINHVFRANNVQTLQQGRKAAGVE